MEGWLSPVIYVDRLSIWAWGAAAVNGRWRWMAEDVVGCSGVNLCCLMNGRRHSSNGFQISCRFHAVTDGFVVSGSLDFGYASVVAAIDGGEVVNLPI
ncbi:hypothetical protein ACLOJK_039279 [Asimina triloba]